MSASLYVGDLLPEVSEALLFEIFNAVGPVVSVRVCRDNTTRRSLGYAYVNYSRAEDAERSLDTLNFKMIRSKPCRIMWSHRDPGLRKSNLGNIFVNGLDKSIDNKSLYDTFSVFGNILSCKVSHDPRSESRGYAFVHYENEESGQEAINRVNGKVIAGKVVTVELFKTKQQRGKDNKNVFTNVFVKNLDATATKESVDAMFSKFGVVTSSALTVDRDNASRAFAFVNFGTPEEATSAVDGLNDFDLGEGRKLFVGRAQKKEERERELRQRFEEVKNERQKKFAGVNLYIKNLGDEVDDEKLRGEFVKYGSITSAKVMRDQGGKSKGFGFVCFTNPEEATKAVTEMNNHMLDSKPLYVALAQRKDVRRSQLEQQWASRTKMGAGGMAGAPGPFPYQPNMMFPGGPQGPAGFPRQNFMYPTPNPMAMRGRFNPNQPPAPQMMGQGGMRGPAPGQGGAPTGPVNYQLMPFRGPMPPMMNGGGGYQQGGPQRGGRGANRQGGGQHNPRQLTAGGNGQQGGGKDAGNSQGIKYTDNVRNRNAAPVSGSTPGSTAGVQDSAAPTTTDSLLKALSSSTQEQQKQIIGERLFPLIQALQPSLAGKITGMLLEMDNGELLHLLESQTALQEKIAEALAVLHEHGFEGETEADGDKQ